MKVIYMIINLTNNKKYIGSTTNFSRRKVKHLWMLNSNRHHSISLQHSWNKSIPENYKFIILEKLSELDNKFEKEQFYLDFYKTYDKKYGYNIAKYAEGPVPIEYPRITI